MIGYQPPTVTEDQPKLHVVHGEPIISIDAQTLLICSALAKQFVLAGQEKHLREGYSQKHAEEYLRSLLPSSLHRHIPAMVAVGYQIHTSMLTEPCLDSTQIHVDMKNFFDSALKKNDRACAADLIAMVRWLACPHEALVPGLRYDLENLRWSFYELVKNDKKAKALLPKISSALIEMSIELADGSGVRESYQTLADICKNDRPMDDQFKKHQLEDKEPVSKFLNTFIPELFCAAIEILLASPDKDGIEETFLFLRNAAMHNPVFHMIMKNSIDILSIETYDRIRISPPQEVDIVRELLEFLQGETGGLSLLPQRVL